MKRTTESREAIIAMSWLACVGLMRFGRGRVGPGCGDEVGSRPVEALLYLSNLSFSRASELFVTELADKRHWSLLIAAMLEDLECVGNVCDAKVWVSA